MKAKRFSKEALQFALARRYFQSRRAQFYEDYAEAVLDTEPMIKFLSIRHARAIRQKSPLAILYKRWISRIDKEGGKLSYILAGSVPSSDIMMLSAIEDKGALEKSLMFLARTIREQREMAAAMRAAVTMPIIIGLVMIVFLSVLSFYVIPIFVQVAPVKKWVSIGKAIYYISFVVVHYGVFLLAGVIAVAVWFKWSLANWTGKRRVKFDRFMPYRLFRDNEGAIFLVSLATMLKAGDSVSKALSVLRRRSTPWMRWHITAMLRNLDRNFDNPGEAFNTGLFSQELSNRINDYARRSGRLDEVMVRIGIEGIGQVRKEIEKSAKVFNVLLTLLMGAVLAFMLLGIVLTGQGLSTALKQEVTRQQVR